MLTPESDGNYYHTVQSGETLLGIANLYDVSLNELMTWNSLDASSIIYPEHKLILQVTPPASATPTPAPSTPTITLTTIPPTRTPTLNSPEVDISPVADVSLSTSNSNNPTIWFVIVGLATGGILLIVLSTRKSRKQ
jgi:LysM repeat protein